MSPPRVSSKRLVAALQLDGFRPARQAKGSHQAFQKKVGDRTITVVAVLGKKEIPPGTIRSILRQWEITEDRLRELL